MWVTTPADPQRKFFGPLTFEDIRFLETVWVQPRGSKGVFCHRCLFFFLIVFLLGAIHTWCGLRMMVSSLTKWKGSDLMHANARRLWSRLASACAVRLYPFLRGHCYARAQLLPRSHYGQRKKQKQTVSLSRMRPTVHTLQQVGSASVGTREAFSRIACAARRCTVWGPNHTLPFVWFWAGTSRVFFFFFLS